MTFKSNSAFLAGNDRFEGYLADLLRLLATSIGFDYEIRLTRDGKHGEQYDDDQWDGMIGDLLSMVTDCSNSRDIYCVNNCQLLLLHRPRTAFVCLFLSL